MSDASTFQSALGPEIRAHIELKRALGRQFQREAGILGDLDRFLVASDEQDLTAGVFARWALTLERLAPASRRQYLRIAHNLCQYRQRANPECFVPDPAGFPDPGPQRPALILCDQQIRDLLSAAASLPALVRSPLQPEVYRQAIALAYASGLRRGEIVRLAISDWDPQRCTLHVRESKSRKSRLVALSDSASAAIERYLAARRRFPHAPDAPLLANGRDCSHRYSGRGIDLGFRRLFRMTGIRGVGDRPARLHDLRHYSESRIIPSRVRMIGGSSCVFNIVWEAMPLTTRNNRGVGPSGRASHILGKIYVHPTLLPQSREPGQGA